MSSARNILFHYAVRSENDAGSFGSNVLFHCRQGQSGVLGHGYHSLVKTGNRVHAGRRHLLSSRALDIMEGIFLMP
jgi:hypothetical protein